ncbi:MAG: hypothetical protein U5J98_00205 [Halobacteriales archaeon]|nr:hypothetical protein [Halobacteriales archaeon]
MGDAPPGTVGIPEEELEGDIGTPDVDVMTDIRDLFLDEEPLVEDYSWNDPIYKRELHIHFSEGIDAAWSRLDVTWYTSGAYKFHYVDENDRNWRFDRHPNDHSDEKHFHEPPDADSSSAVKSCIQVEEPGLVARAVMKLWRRAVVAETFENLNTAPNPP